MTQSSKSLPTISSSELLTELSFDMSILEQLESEIPQEILAGEIDQLTHIFQSTIDQQLNCVLSFDGFFDEKVMKKAVALSFFVEPVLGCRFVVDGTKSFWKRRKDFLAKITCEFTSVDDPAPYISSFVTSPIDPRQDLPLRIAFYRTKVHDILCLKVSHEALDGTAVKEYLALLVKLYNALKKNPNFLPQPKKEVNRSLKQIFQHLTFLQKLNVLFHLRAGKPTKAFPWKSLEAKRRAYEIIYFTKEQYRKIKTLSRKMRVSITAFLITAFHRAVTRFITVPAGKKILSTITVNLRSFLPNPSSLSLCNLTSSANIYSKYHPEESFEGTLSQVLKSMDKRKKAGIGLGSALFCRLLFRTNHAKAHKILEKRIIKQRKTAQTFPVITNLGLANSSDFNFLDLKMTDAFILPPFIKAPAFMIGALTFNEKLSLSIAYFEESYEPSKVKAFLHEIKHELLSFTNQSLETLL